MVQFANGIFLKSQGFSLIQMTIFHHVFKKYIELAGKETEGKVLSSPIITEICSHAAIPDGQPDMRPDTLLIRKSKYYIVLAFVLLNGEMIQG